MLLRFSARNHLSIRDAQELSMTASSLRDADAGLISCDAAPDGRLVPAAVIYGANASGKTNLLSALRFMRRAVLLSHSQGEPDGGVPRKPFALDPGCTEAPSSFDADFVITNVRYHYGFTATNDAFASEWLYSFPNNRRLVLFERNGAEFKFGRALKGKNRLIAELTRPNSLFVSAAAQNDHEELSKISRYFRSIRSDHDVFVSGFDARRHLAKNDVDRRTIAFLQKIETGIVNVRRQETNVGEEVRLMRKELGQVLSKFVKSASPDSSIVDDLDMKVSIQLSHRGKDGLETFFELERESAGTRRLLVLLGPVFRSLDEGSVLVIDELNASLHTQACEAVLTLFSRHDTNPKGAQLITTTHDTNLLRSPILRRDQVWFTEKDSNGATHIYPLTDIRTRQGDNIEKGYLQGRFGALPFSGPIPELSAVG